jgi:methylthioribose-1-phosphate isomerase
MNSIQSLHIEAGIRALRAFVFEEGVLRILDQRALPGRTTWLSCSSVEEVAQAIECLAVRGAPAIGGAAALGMLLALDAEHIDDVKSRCAAADERLRKTRPTAVNLFVALDRVRAAWLPPAADAASLRARVVAAARGYVEDDRSACDALAAHGRDALNALIDDDSALMTICHTGALATCGGGTALHVLGALHAARPATHAVALETRPLLQGARLTAWECQQRGIPVTLITDSMAAFYMQQHKVGVAVVGADRIARNGDTANKVGTFALALACAHHGVPLFVAAPTTTIDVQCDSGAHIVIEQRHADEVRAFAGSASATPSTPVWNPSFDVTPAHLIRGYITERGVLSSSMLSKL